MLAVALYHVRVTMNARRLDRTRISFDNPMYETMDGPEAASGASYHAE